MKTIVNTENAPKAIGTYSQAVKVGNLLFLSGQIPLDPETGSMVSGGIEQQIEQVIANLQAVCEASGASLDSIVKLNVYLTDLGDFALVNQTMSRHFSEPYPARAAVQVSALPKGARVEIEAIAEINT